MPIAAAQTVKCVEGCGGDSTLAIVGIVIAFLSFLVAFAAWRIALHSLRISRREHEVFMRQLNARADFNVQAYIVDLPRPLEDGVLELDVPEVTLKWQLGIENTGTKAANDVDVNFLIPREGVERFEWITQANVPAHDPQRHGPMTTAEELVANDDSRHPAWYLVRQIPRVTRRSHPVLFASCVAKMPEEPGAERVVPFKFTVSSDDLPDDVEDREWQREFRLRRYAVPPATY